MYEIAPPAYEEATRRDPWLQIVQYLPRESLTNLSRANRHLNEVANKQLWGNAASHFDPTLENPDAVIDSYILYLKSLISCRASTAALARTIHLPPFTEGQHDFSRELLLLVLARTRKLQALIVSGVAKFDHGLLTKKQSIINPALRLLVARNCDNATSFGLALLICNLHQLEYLDLSYSKGASSTSVIDMIVQNIGNLKVLKLRATKLTNESLFQVLRESDRQPNLQYLDVRDNGMCVESVGYSFRGTGNDSGEQGRSWVPPDFDFQVFKNIAWPEFSEHYRGTQREGIACWLLSGNSLSADYACRSIFSNAEMHALDMGPAKPIIVDELAVKSGQRLTFLRMPVSNLFQKVEVVSAQSVPDRHFDELPDYEQAVNLEPASGPFALAQPQARVHSRILEYFVALETLVLTSIPARFTDADTTTIDLVKLIMKFYAAAHHASGSQQVGEGQSRYSLHTITLEVQQNSTPDSRYFEVVSSTGDEDSENLWSAAADDFSFFASERPEKAEEQAPGPSRDFVTELAKWRADRRNAWTRRRFYSIPLDALAKEHWPGQVRIVPAPLGQAGRAVKENWDHFASLEGRCSQ